MRGQRWNGFCALALLIFAGASCSHPRPYDSGREGLIDALAELPEADRLPAARKQKEGAVRTISEYRLRRFRKSSGRWKWPLKDVVVTSHFGPRGRHFHEGVDLRAKTGTPVYAAQGGIVVHAGRRFSGYGRMILVKHPSGLTTLYAHNSKLLVREGQRVKRGQKIAVSGSTGRSRGPHLHFEIRDGETPIDPVLLLPRGIAKNDVSLETGRTVAVNETSEAEDHAH